MNFSSPQLTQFYLDGNIQEAFEVFEHAGPQGLRQFLGIDDRATWERVYATLIHEYHFLGQLLTKYRTYFIDLIRDRGIPTLCEALEITPSTLLDELHASTMSHTFRKIQRSHVGEFFVSLREMLRRDIEL